MSEQLPSSEVNVLKGHEGAVLAARFNGNGEYCLSCGKDRTIRLWDSHEDLPVKFTMSTSPRTTPSCALVVDCCLTNSDAHVIGGSEDGYIYFWDLVDASVVSKFRAHSSVVTSVSYHPKDSCMITASVDGTIRVWKS